MSPTQFLSSKPLHAKVLERPDDIDALVPGDVVQSWDPYFVWTSSCESHETRKRWRNTSDPLADAALSTIVEKGGLEGTDLLFSLTQHDSDPSVQAFLSSVSNIPPDIAASYTQISEGQDFFAQHAVQISMSLLYFSLAGGFASPRISRVLRSTSYLVPSKPTQADPSPTQKTQILTRLMETMQFVIDVMGGSLPPSPSDALKSQWRGPATLTPHTGEGWRSCIRVRMLHALARRRVLSKRTEDGSGRFFDPVKDGVPINQEDLAHTLAAFSFVPLHSLPKLGLGFTRGQADSFISLWRHVGFLMGVDPRILKRHFANWESAEMFGATCGQILILELREAEAEGQHLEPATIPMLVSLDGMMDSPLSDRLAICRYLIGDTPSDLLRLPRTTFRAAIHIRGAFILAALPVWFGTWHRKAWEAERRTLTVEGVGRMVRWKLGMRRTAFRPRGESGDLDPGVMVKEGVVRVEEDVQRFVGAWKRVMREMTVVLVSMGVLGFGSLVTLWWIS